MSESIPRLILQTAPNMDLSVLGQASQYTLQTLNPSFDYMFFDDNAADDFMNSVFPSYRNVIESFKYKIQKYDFFRYLAIYHFGGFYFDLDIVFSRPLESLLSCEAVFSFEELTAFQFLRDMYNMDWSVGNYAFGAAPHHPLIKAIIENCVRAQSDSRWMNSMLRPIPWIFQRDFMVLCTTGPGLVSRTIAERPELADKLTILFPENVNDPLSWSHFGDFGIHLATGNWRQSSGGFNSGIRRFLEQRWFSRLRRRQLTASAKMGPKRNMESLRNETIHCGGVKA